MSRSSSAISPTTTTDSSSYSSSWHTTDYSESQATSDAEFSLDRQSSGNNMSTATTHKRGNHRSTSTSNSDSSSLDVQQKRSPGSPSSSEHSKTDLIRAMTERRKRRKEAAFNQMKESLGSTENSRSSKLNQQAIASERRRQQDIPDDYGGQDSFSSESISVPSGVIASTGDSVELARGRNKSPLTLPAGREGDPSADHQAGRMTMKRPVTPGQRAPSSSPSTGGGGNSSYGGSTYSIATSSDGEADNETSSSGDTTQFTTDSGLRQCVAIATKSGHRKTMRGIVKQNSNGTIMEENTVFLDRVEEEEDEDDCDSDTSIEIPLSERGLNGEVPTNSASRKPLRKKTFMKRKSRAARTAHYQEQQEIVIADAYPVHAAVEAVPSADAFYDNHHHHHHHHQSYNSSYEQLPHDGGDGGDPAAVGYYNPHDNSAGTLDSFFPRLPYAQMQQLQQQQQQQEQEYGVNKIVINPQHQLMMSKDLDSEYSSSLAPRQGSIDVNHLRRRQQWQRCVGACSVMVLLVVVTAGIGAYFGLQMGQQQPDGDNGVSMAYPPGGDAEPAEITHGTVDSYYNYGYGAPKIDRANSTGLTNSTELGPEVIRGGLNGTNATDEVDKLATDSSTLVWQNGTEVLEPANETEALVNGTDSNTTETNSTETLLRNKERQREEPTPDERFRQRRLRGS